ncbi:MAG: hypothetical protein ABI255_02810 [Microbacteriaceae bacterium]
MDSGEFDPRFDPAFQPGFDPEKHRPRSLRLFEHGASAASASAHPVTPGEMASGSPGQASVRAQMPGPDRDGSELEPALIDADDDRPPVPLRRNPYVWVLWLVSSGMVLGGFGMYWWANSEPGGFSWDGSSPSFLLLLQQSAWVMSPAMVTAGLAGLLGLLFLYAVRWRPGGRVGQGQMDEKTAVMRASSL